MSAYLYDSETKSVGADARRRLAELEAEQEAAASLDDSPNYLRMAWLSLRCVWDRFGVHVAGLLGAASVLLLYKYGWALALLFTN